MRTAIVLIGLVIGSWLSFDGTRAWIKGNYVTSRSGELGPWAHLVSMIGIDPHSGIMKSTHVVLGALWLFSVALVLAKISAGKFALLGCSILSLWYVPVGTALAIVEIALLFLSGFRHSQ